MLRGFDEVVVETGRQRLVAAILTTIATDRHHRGTRRTGHGVQLLCQRFAAHFRQADVVQAQLWRYRARHFYE